VLFRSQWGIAAAADLIRARRVEDTEAAKILGAKTIRLDYLDCIYRRGKNGNWLYADIFVPPHEDEADLPAQIAESISARLAPDAVLVCPLGLGLHIDHILVRRAVETLAYPIFYYADVPYLFRSPHELAPNTLEMRQITHRLEESAVEAWQNAAGAYVSQIGSLFESPEAMRAQIREYAVENDGIRLWRYG
ncbi:MAG: hypothetical protein PHQ36_13010, partial [Anaerolineales bacterium]|nr:hypothetical protein [Anaerolineales bacterium]